MRLGKLGVLDSDCEAAEVLAKRLIADGELPETAFAVRTVRGVHRYYRLAAQCPKFLHRHGVTMEFRNQGQYVVGPGSQHPSGGLYAAYAWSWKWDDIPFLPPSFRFDDGSCGRRSGPTAKGQEYEFPKGLTAGERHAELFRQVRQFKAWGNDREATRQIISMANTWNDPPIREDAEFEAWFERAWTLPDRPQAPSVVANPFGGDTEVPF